MSKSKKGGVESAGKERGNWRVKGGGMEEEKRKWKLSEEYVGKGAQQGNIGPQQQD